MQDKSNLPGKIVRVAAVCIGTGGDYNEKIEQAIEYLHISGENEVDLACLPEAFASTELETIPGPATDAIAKIARQHQMYVICPVCENTDDEGFNTAVLIDRNGWIVGKYRKVFAFWGEGVSPGREGVGIFDTDFGRIGILTCFDINFPELWNDADILGSEIVFWPSAYGGGIPLNAFAMLYHYYIVPVGYGNIIDITGENMKGVHEPKDKLFIADIDLDRTLIHTNFTGEKVARLLAEHKEIVSQEHFYEMEAWYLLKATKPGVSVRDLCKQYEIETLRQYLHRSRRQINELRENGGVV